MSISRSVRLETNTMNTLCLLIFVVGCCCASELPQFVPGRRVFARFERTTLQSPLECLASPPGQQCATDCRTMMTCSGVAGRPVFAQTCVNINPKLPYCVNGGCTATPDVSNVNCATAFQCTSAGSFPDPTDCSKYRICDSPGGDAELYECPAEYSYIPSLNLCERRNNDNCNTIDCSNVKNRITVLNRNEAFYAFCVKGRKAEILMYKCVDIQNEIYDISAGACRYNCKDWGTFPDRTNCNGYVTCAHIDGRWRATKQKCAPGNQFKGNACVPEGETACVSEIQ